MTDVTDFDSFAGCIEGLDSDKEFRHHYGQHYDFCFSADYRNRVRDVLELGVQWGPSLILWERYFPQARITGLDINPESLKYSTPRSKVYLADQNSREQLEIATGDNTFDVIVDDASHVFASTITSFEFLWDKIKVGGWYVIEDLQVSGDPEFGGHPSLSEHNSLSGYFAKHLNLLMCTRAAWIKRSVVAPGIIFLQKQGS